METSAGPDSPQTDPLRRARWRGAMRPRLPKPPRLSEDLTRLLEISSAEAITLRQVMSVLRGRGTLLLALLLALPFCTAIPLPGLSTPFGLVIAWIAFRLALGQKPWLPAKLLDVAVAPRLFRRVLTATRGLLRGLEHISRPRLVRFTESPLLRRLHAVPMLVAAILLLLPLPIPFTNLVPAYTVVLFCAGMLERDGALIIAGYISFAVTCAFFGVIFFAGAQGVEVLRHWVAARFGS